MLKKEIKKNYLKCNISRSQSSSTLSKLTKTYKMQIKFIYTRVTIIKNRTKTKYSIIFENPKKICHKN